MSFFKQAAARRVPQILGMYVAGTWMVIEIGDWLIEKFSLSESITAYIFVALAVLFPAVAVVAWFHGAPGKDHWTPVEKTVIPLNLVAVAAALYVFSQQDIAVPTVEPSQTRIVVDETGTSQTFEVPSEAFHKNITLFFLSNETGDESHDWLSYAVPLLVEHDLNHESHLVTATTPFGSESLKESMLERGFDKIVGAPRSLQLTIARERRSQALLSGTLELINGELHARVRLMDVTSGAALAEFDENLSDLLPAADRISLVVQHKLEIDPKSDTENDPLRDNLTANLDAMRGFVDAHIAIELSNDYPAGIAALTAATDIDNQFAQAFGDLANLHYFNGNTQNAIELAHKALKHDYKLSVASRFLIKTRRYVYENDFENAVKVLNMWTQVEPLNPRAFALLGRVMMLTGQNHEEALANLQRALTLNPTSHRLYSFMATIEQGRGNVDAAAEHVHNFLKVRPEDVEAHLQLAMIYMSVNDYDKAREAYQDAELVSVDELGASLGMAGLALRMGDFDDVSSRLDKALLRTLTPQQRVETLTMLSELQFMRGELKAMLGTVNDLDEVAAQFMPPVMRVVNEVREVDIQMMQGNFDGARKTLKALHGQVEPPLDLLLEISDMYVDWEQGNEQKAMQTLDLIEQSSENLTDPSSVWSMAYARMYRHVFNDDPEQAVLQVDEALQRFDDLAAFGLGSTIMDIELLVNAARLMRRVGAVEKARELLTESLLRAPRLATAHLEMAYLALEFEEVAEARASLNEALDIWRNGDEQYLRRQEAQQLLASLDL